MTAAKLTLTACIAMLATPALADSGDYGINDWAPPIAQSVSREQVRKELREAQARGELSYGERGPELRPGPSTRSRAEVKAELREAIRLGLVSHGEHNIPVATPEQLRRIEQAGRDAAERLAKAQRGGQG